jgi:hypothetical protein
VHARDPEIILQVAIFEIVTRQVKIMDDRDADHVAWRELLDRVRKFAAGRRAGGITPSGRAGENFGGHWIWSYDEISWFAHQSREYRDQWLRYAWDWIRKTDPAGYLQMPGSRTIQPPVEGKGWYFANRRSDACPGGLETRRRSGRSGRRKRHGNSGLGVSRAGGDDGSIGRGGTSHDSYDDHRGGNR